MLSGEHHRRALDFGESSKQKEPDNSLHLGPNPKTPRRSPHQFLSSIAHDASLQIKTDEHDSSSGQMSDSELLSFAVGGSSMVEGRGSVSEKKQKIGDVQVPDMLFKDSKDMKESDEEEWKEMLNEQFRTAFDEKCKKMKTYLSRNLNPKQLLAMKANLVKLRQGLMSPSDKTSDSFFICVGKNIDELKQLEPAEICAHMHTSLAHWIACRRNEFTQVFISSFLYFSYTQVETCIMNSFFQDLLQSEQKIVDKYL